MYRAKWWWVLASTVAAGASMHSFAQIQRTLLRSAGVDVKQWRSEAAYYAANSLSTTLPGGPVHLGHLLLRQQRLWGASTVVASWQLVMSGVLQAVGLALLGLGGAFFLGAKNNPFSLLFTLGGFIALLLLGAGGGIAARTHRRYRRAGAVVDQLGSRQAGDTGLDKWREMLSQLESVSLGRRDLAVAFSWSLFNWIADVACLGFAAYAAGDNVSVAGLTVAYAAARAVGTIPLMPGGLLVVEAVLVPGLVSSGMTLPNAISAMLIYRLISWLLHLRHRLGDVLLPVPHRERGGRGRSGRGGAHPSQPRPPWNRPQPTPPIPRYRARCRRRSAISTGTATSVKGAALSPHCLPSQLGTSAYSR